MHSLLLVNRFDESHPTSQLLGFSDTATFPCSRRKEDGSTRQNIDLERQSARLRKVQPTWNSSKRNGTRQYPHHPASTPHCQIVANDYFRLRRDIRLDSSEGLLITQSCRRVRFISSQLFTRVIQDHTLYQKRYVFQK